jgi:outer membrane protein OmpA-like peptidoglycan-associated protein
MRRYSMISVLTLVMLLIMMGAPAPSQAQDTGGLTDFRGRSSYSAEDLAHALFPEPTPEVRTRGMGPARPSPALPVPRAAVTLNVLFAPNSNTIPSSSYAEIDKLGTVLSWPQYTEYRIQFEGHTDNRALSASQAPPKSVSRVLRITSYNTSTLRLSACRRLAMVRADPSRPTIRPRGAARTGVLPW